MRNAVFTILFSCACISVGFTQEKVVNIDTVKITTDLLLRYPDPKIQFLEKKQISLLQAEDVGQLVQKFAGVSLKSYGGLGGMKTISVRGIGGNHNGIVVNGFMVQNNQTGQLDLSNIQVENIERISLTIGGVGEELLPVSAYLGGSVLSVKTFENSRSPDRFQVRSTIKAGSFDQRDYYLSFKFSRKQSFVSVFGKYRQANGNYPYSFRNGTQTYSGNRLNNQLQEGFAGFNLGFERINSRGGTNQFILNYQFNQSAKGLPGAVILYNPTANQYLNNESHQLNLSYLIQLKRTVLKNYLSARYENLNYLDSSYLNQAGFLDQSFFNSSVQHGVSFTNYGKSGKFPFYGGIEQNFSQLESSIADFEQPRRYQLKSVLGLKLKKPRIQYIFQLGGEAVFDYTRIQTTPVNKYVFTPYFLLQTMNQGIFGRARIWSKRSFRMPTFNELYYNQFGNKNLKPEIANQINLGTTYEINIKNNAFSLSADAYFNLVENKIVAIPTKNLFVWSVQNIGLVQILGTDLVFTHRRSYNDAWFLNTRLSYTCQKVLDLSDKNSPTFKNQVPYIPQHLGNVDFSCSYKETGIGISGTVLSKRYSLYENIPANEVAGFYLIDVSVYRIFPLKKGSELKFTFTLKNLLNEQYAYVRYYVMPGRNFLISLAYALH